MTSAPDSCVDESVLICSRFHAKNYTKTCILRCSHIFQKQLKHLVMMLATKLMTQIFVRAFFFGGGGRGGEQRGGLGAPCVCCVFLALLSILIKESTSSRWQRPKASRKPRCTAIPFWNRAHEKSMSVLQSQVLKGSVPLQAITIAFILCGLSANINASVLRFLWHSTIRQPLSQAWLNSNYLVDLLESISSSNKLGHCLEHPVE